MIQTEDNLLHRHLPFSDDPRGVEQHQAAHEAYDQVAIVRILAVHLTGSGRERVKVRRQCSIQLRRFHARISRSPLMAVSRQIT
jgi:hypothetical protein